MSRFFLSAFFVIFVALFQHSLQKSTRFSNSSAAHKICVPETSKNACSQMVSEGAKQGVPLICVIGRDRLDCLEKIAQHNADFSYVDPEDMYVAAVLDNQKYIILKEVRNKDQSEAEFRYKGVAVIRNDYNLKGISSLKGAKSCHTGIGRNVGYKIPLTKLTKMKVIGPLSDTSISPRENELKAFSTFFSKACIVGKWAPDDATNKRLKSQYSNLCALCENPQICDYPDENSGYRGALKCLNEGGGDIAWTKTHFVDEYFGLKGTKTNNAENYSYLCPDGKKVPLSQSPCTWAARPWSGYIADASLNDTETLRSELSKLNKLGEAVGSEWFTMILRLDNKSVTVDNANKLHPYEYLSKAKYYDVIDRNVVAPRRSIRWCVISEAAHNKCASLKLAAFSRDIRPEFDCVIEKSVEKCLKTIRDGGADVLTVDAADALNAAEKYNLRVVAAEKYYKNITDLYAVAVIKSNSTYQSFRDLQGKKSCHSPDMKSAGWVAPLFTLLQIRLINESGCDSSDSLAKFFSGGSCLPQSPEKSAAYPQLVSLCGKKTKDGFEEYKGPLKCLLNDEGDVAFVSSINLIKSIDENKTSENDIQLLCPDGSRVSFSQYDQCNLGRIPPKVVLTSNQKSNVEIDEVKNALLALSDLYGPYPELFKLFGRYKKNNNVLFSNTAIGLNLIEDLSTAINQDFQFMYSTVNRLCPAKQVEETLTAVDSDKFLPKRRSALDSYKFLPRRR